MIKTKLALFCIIALYPLGIISLAPINLFRPSDRPLIPEVWPDNRFQFVIGYEGSVKSKGFRDDFDECFQIGKAPDIEKKVNVLQIYQSSQNVLAAFKNFDCCSKMGQLSQLFNINDENGDQGIFIPKGNFKVPVNLMLSARYYFNHGVSFALHLPFYVMELSDVRWFQKRCDETGSDKLTDQFIETVCKATDLDITGWRRKGVGDLLAQGLWRQDFPQNKPLLTNVRTQLRLGLYFPTGKKEDEDKILAIPFGNDGAYGLLLSGGLDLTFNCFTRGGFDVEFLYLFGNTRCRRLATACNQTDLLFLSKVPVFKEFGLGQQYNLYLETFWRGLIFNIDYQFLKRNEDKIFIFNDRIDAFVANSAESLQDWTAHSLIFSLKYDFRYITPSHYAPMMSLWAKWGFNGKRAILLDTIGATFTLNF